MQSFGMKAVKSLMHLSLMFALAIVHEKACSAQEETTSPTAARLAPFKLDTKHLPNAIQIHERVASGGQPDGEQGFLELKELRFKTIVSVDGAKPDVAIARQFGLRYVHLPHGYSGIDPERVSELAKAIRDLDGPIYIHCHHGKHRSPAAAAVACISAGLIEPDPTCSILKLAGTSENYRGLFDVVKSAHRIAESSLDAIQPEFPESAKLPPMAVAMVDLERTYAQLEQLAHSQWKPSADHPALDPAHEALLLREQFTEMLRMESVVPRTVAFRKFLIESKSDAKLLEETLRMKKQEQNASPSASSRLSELFARISANCTNCHQQYRDAPIERKY